MSDKADEYSVLRASPACSLFSSGIPYKQWRILK